MEVKFDVALQTVMEVFDYLIINDILIFKAEDFKSAKITISEDGFILTKQVRRGVWEEDDKSMDIYDIQKSYQEPRKQLISATNVLQFLIGSVEKALDIYDIPSYQGDYAYLHDRASEFETNKNPRMYFKSYQEMMNVFKKARSAKQTYLGTGGKIISKELIDNFAKKFKRLSTREKRVIECYAKLEETLERILRDIWIQEFGAEKFIESERLDWGFIAGEIENNYCPALIKEEQKNRRDEGRNPLISPLGLDGLTI